MIFKSMFHKRGKPSLFHKAGRRHYILSSIGRENSAWPRDITYCFPRKEEIRLMSLPAQGRV